MSLLSSPVDPSVSAATVVASLGQRLPFPAFPLRAALPPLAPVRAAGPPAEYHSDSAESLEEIPVALAQLGSAAVSPRASAALPALPPVLPPLPSPQPRTKRKAPSRKPGEQRFEMLPQPPGVFLSRPVVEPLDLRDRPAPEEPRSSLGKRKQTSKRSLEEPGSRTGTPLP